jgi:hypothetical protein
MNPQAFSEQMNQVIAKAWTDETFKAGLLADPAKALAAMGWQVPSHIQLKVVENTHTDVYLVLPRNPGSGHLSEEALDSLTGAGGDVVPGACSSGGGIPITNYCFTIMISSLSV